MRFKDFWMIIVILFLMVSLFPYVQASPKVVIYRMEVTATPQVQGKELPLDIVSEVGFGGACCYTVYAHDVRAEIFLPENVTLIDGDKIQMITSSGHPSGTVAAEPGGGLTWLSQTWSVKAEEYGEYALTVHVTGKNELGDQINVSKSVNIAIASGASISAPVLPRNPSVDEEIIIVARVSSSDNNVEGVTLHFSRNQKDWIPLPMDNAQEDVWIVSITGQENEGKVYYYIESLDDEGEIFTTEIYELEVRDIPKLGFLKFLTTYGTLFAFIIGIGLIFFIDNRRKAHSLSSGMKILGASLRLSALRNLDDIKDEQERLRKLRMRIIYVLSIATIILILVAITTGQLQEVISQTSNSTGG
jgi:hypothetical protein